MTMWFFPVTGASDGNSGTARGWAPGLTMSERLQWKKHGVLLGFYCSIIYLYIYIYSCICLEITMKLWLYDIVYVCVLNVLVEIWMFWWWCDSCSGNFAVWLSMASPVNCLRKWWGLKRAMGQPKWDNGNSIHRLQWSSRYLHGMTTFQSNREGKTDWTEIAPFAISHR